MIGQTISHYKILEKLGEGGMGVVYKAEDLKLKRTVAIKFLPRPLSAQPEERERFTLEAQAASALNHPNVATIYEIDDADGESFIVMEYVDGQTLGEVKAKLTIKQMVEIGIQVAEGIAAAHEKGIIHRDVKADNIMLRKDARVQVMDFGLAKLRGMSRLTKAGSTVGTIAYMSPEQVQGLEADHRTDIFSLGVVLYELLTARLPFKGEHEAALMYEILNVDPSRPSSIQIGIDADLDRIVMKCLEKDREERYQSVKDVAVDLRHFKRDSEGKRISRGGVVQAVEKTEARLEEGARHDIPSPSRESLPAGKAGVSLPAVFLEGMRVKIGIAAAALILIAVLATLLLQQEIAPPLITSTHPLTNVPGLEANPSWSPDGTRIAYMSDESGNFDIYVQQVSAGQKLNITKEHTGNDRDPSWSPDGEWIAYISDRDGGGIFVSPALGGTARRVYTAPSATEIPHDVSWSPDGSKLIFAVIAELFTIPSAGGKVEQLRLERDRHAFFVSKPSWSIDGSRIVYAEVAGSGISTSKLWSVRVDGRDPVSVTDGTTFDRSPIWSRDGIHLFFVSDRGGSPDIWWVPVTSRGEPRALARALTVGAGVGTIALSSDGTKLAYSKVVDRANIWVLPFVHGRLLTMKDASPITSENFVIEQFEISPDGKLIAFDSNRRGNADIYVMKTDGSDLRQITTDKAHDWVATWSPDGKRIAFHSLSTGNREIFTVPVEGGPVTQLTNHPAKDWAPRWSPTGKEIAFGSDRTGRMEVWIVPAEGGEARQLTRIENWALLAWSPNGRHIAFTSLHSGEPNLFVIPREGGDPYQVTRGGWFGLNPQYWSKDGRTIYVGGVRGTGSSPSNIWEVSVADGKIRQVTDFRETSKRFDRFTTDGKRIFALFSESVGDIWLAELGKEK